MSECVTLNTNGTLTDDGPVSSSTSAISCAGYVLVDAGQYGVVAPVVSAAYGVPSVSDACTWFVGAWGAVVFFYVVARMCGSVVGMFNSK